MLTRATGVWTENAVGVDDCRALAKRLKDEVVEAGPDGATMLVVVERTQDFDGSMAEDDLVELFKAIVNSEQCVVAEADSGFFNSNYGMSGSLKSSRSGAVAAAQRRRGVGLRRRLPRRQPGPAPRGPRLPGPAREPRTSPGGAAAVHEPDGGWQRHHLRRLHRKPLVPQRGGRWGVLPIEPPQIRP